MCGVRTYPLLEEIHLSKGIPRNQALIRAPVVLILETGMRSHREALALMWEAIDFANDSIRVRESKTRAGIRNIPLSAKCKAEFLRWRDMFGPEFSPFVFPKVRTPNQPLNDVRRSWEKTLEDAKLPKFVLYDLRHSYASRLSAAGVSDLFVAQTIGHSSPSIRAFCKHMRRPLTSTGAMQSANLRRCGLLTLPAEMLLRRPLTEASFGTESGGLGQRNYCSSTAVAEFSTWN